MLDDPKGHDWEYRLSVIAIILCVVMAFVAIIAAYWPGGI